MLILPSFALLLASCQEPSFDERYSEAETKIREQAQSVDAELARRTPTREAAEGGGRMEGETAHADDQAEGQNR